MRIRVLAFGVLRELLPSADFCLDVPGPCTVGQFVDRLAEEHGASAAHTPAARVEPSSSAVAVADIWSSIAVAVNREYVDRSRPLADGDELALLPPVSGGSSQPLVALTHNLIDTPAILASVRHPEDGAVAIFDGIVRNNTRGRRTRFLIYEAYEEMALQQMQQLAAEARRRFPIHEVAIVHRLGKLEIGESSVLIAVCSAHRAAAFDACRWLIDTLKKTVPVWKQEHFEDGAVWAPGEAFPPEIVPETSR
jgi:molybdopterin synthase catalytic subunit